MNKIAALAVLAMLVGCASGPSPSSQLGTMSHVKATRYAEAGAEFLADGGTKETLLAKAQEAVAGQLKDPDSAKFRNVELRTSSEGTVVCGEVNGKNSYGGYTGFTRFVAGPSGGTLKTDEYLNSNPDIHYAVNFGLHTFCTQR